MSNVDVKTLERLAAKMKEDATVFQALSPAAMRSIAGIIEDCIGAPLGWPSRVAGNLHADTHYSGSPAQRLAFNHGVKWAVEHYDPTTKVNLREPHP